MSGDRQSKTFHTALSSRRRDEPHRDRTARRARRCALRRRWPTSSTRCSGSGAAGSSRGSARGDHESRSENESFGLEFGTVEDRLVALDTRVARRWVAATRSGSGGTLAAVRTSQPARRQLGTVGEYAGRGSPRESRTSVAVDGRRGVRGALLAVVGRLVVLGEDEAAAKRRTRQLDPAPDVVVGGPERVAERLLNTSSQVQSGSLPARSIPQTSTSAAILGERIVPLLS